MPIRLGPEPAPAKVNLYLEVLGRRADGYHEIDSLIAFTAAGDRLWATPADTLALTLTGPFAAAAPADGRNLAMRAAAGLASRFGVSGGAHLTLEKNLPVAAGLGGGSADAAAALRLLSRLWDLKVETDDLAPLARDLGADVPACLVSRTVHATGIGQRLGDGPMLSDLPIVLANPGVKLATPSVFAALGGRFSPAGGKGDWRRRRNDLAPAAGALAPGIGSLLAALAAAPGCRLARMSGSGASCFAVMADRRQAAAAARSLTADGLWAVATVLL